MRCRAVDMKGCMGRAGRRYTEPSKAQQYQTAWPKVVVWEGKACGGGAHHSQVQYSAQRRKGQGVGVGPRGRPARRLLACSPSSSADRCRAARWAGSAGPQRRHGGSPGGWMLVVRPGHASARPRPTHRSPSPTHRLRGRPVRPSPGRQQDGHKRRLRKAPLRCVLPAL